MAKRLRESVLLGATRMAAGDAGREFCRNCGGDIVVEPADHRSKELPHRRVCRKCSAEYGTTAATLYPSRRMYESWVALLLLAFVTSAWGADDPLAGYVKSGETQRCVESYEIRQTQVLDDSTVLFRLRVNDLYANTLRQSCSGLKIQGGFKYELRGGNELCRGDIIRVIDSTGTGAACLLGDFEKVAKKPAQPSAK